MKENKRKQQPGNKFLAFDLKLVEKNAAQL